MYELINFPVHGNYQGNLIALEKGADFPFDIKRVYYIWGTQKDVVRGHHAHRKLEQVIICMSGSCDFILDDGHERTTVHLDNPAQGLYIKHNIWREFTNFSPDCVLVVLASEYYDESDYIRNYDEFLEYIKKYVKENNLDSKITVIGALCENKCSEGPRIIVNEKEYTNIDKEKIKEVLDSYKKNINFIHSHSEKQYNCFVESFAHSEFIET